MQWVKKQQMTKKSPLNDKSNKIKYEHSEASDQTGYQENFTDMNFVSF